MSETGRVFHVKQGEEGVSDGRSFVVERLDIVASVWSRSFVKMEVYWF